MHPKNIWTIIKTIDFTDKLTAPSLRFIKLTLKVYSQGNIYDA